MPKPKSQKQSNDSGLNFEAQLWAAADKMQAHMDASEYTHFGLGGLNANSNDKNFYNLRRLLLQ